MEKSNNYSWSMPGATWDAPASASASASAAQQPATHQLFTMPPAPAAPGPEQEYATDPRPIENIARLFADVEMANDQPRDVLFVSQKLMNKGDKYSPKPLACCVDLSWQNSDGDTLAMVAQKNKKTHLLPNPFPTCFGGNCTTRKKIFATAYLMRLIELYPGVASYPPVADKIAEILATINNRAILIDFSMRNEAGQNIVDFVVEREKMWPLVLPLLRRITVKDLNTESPPWVIRPNDFPAYKQSSWALLNQFLAEKPSKEVKKNPTLLERWKLRKKTIENMYHAVADKQKSDEEEMDELLGETEYMTIKRKKHGGKSRRRKRHTYKRRRSRHTRRRYSRG